MRSTRCAVAALFASACTGAGQDIDTLTTPTSGGAPDITGAYDAVLRDLTGCTPPLPDFLTGDLDVSGPSDTLLFVWSSGISLSGSTDESFSVTISGPAEFDGFTLSVAGEGLAYIDADRWVLEVDLTIDAEKDGDSCVQTASLDAVQIGGTK